jgi:DUF4097 and DUF4098 domain-containing protein YvlB
VRKTAWMNALLLVAIFCPLSFAEEWNKTYNISGKADLRVDVDDGGITVRAWDRNEISARVTTHGWQIGPEVRITEQQSGDRVSLEVRTPRVHFSVGHRSLKVELQVPRELRTEIHSGDGGISVNGLKGEIHLSSGDGAIEAESLEGLLQAKTADGHIRASGRWDRLDLETNDGSIEADVRTGSKMAASWRVRTGDGHITLRLPQDFSADLDAHTGDGRITVDFPVTVSGSLRTSEFRGKINSGGEPLIVQTGDGAIHIQPH